MINSLFRHIFLICIIFLFADTHIIAGFNHPLLNHFIAKIKNDSEIKLDTFIYFINTSINIEDPNEILNSNLSSTQNHNYFLSAIIKQPHNWMKLSIQNPDSVSTSQILEISASVDSLVIYEIKENRIVSIRVNSENLPFNQREILSRKPMFVIEFEPYERKEFLIQIVMQGTSYRAPIKISPISKFIENNDKENIIFSFYMGIMGLTVLFSFLLYLLFGQNIIYLFYGCYVLFGLVYMMDSSGYAFHYIFPNLPQIEKHFTYIAIQGTYLFLVLFTNKFFENKKLIRWIRLFNTISVLSIATIVFNLIKFPSFYDFQWKFTIVLLSISCVLTFLITILNFNKNKLKSALFLAGNFLVLGSSLLISISYIVNLKLDFVAYYLPALAHAFESIMILLIIVHEYFSTEKLKNLLSLQVIQEQNKNLILLNKNNKAELDRQKAVNDYQNEVINNQNNISIERSRIASEMHDDLGSGLTTIRYLSNKALKNVESSEEGEQIRKISEQSNELIQNMSEIIWAMNSRNDTMEMLCSYLRRYASEYLDQYKIQLMWNQNIEDGNSVVTGEKRRAIFLVLKEALHNVVKHSKANQVSIKIENVSKKLLVEIHDNGIGFDDKDSSVQGNGLYNMKKRIESVNGSLKIITGSEGTRILIECEL